MMRLKHIGLLQDLVISGTPVTVAGIQTIPRCGVRIIRMVDIETEKKTFVLNQWDNGDVYRITMEKRL